MAKYLDGPFKGKPIGGDNYMKIEGPYLVNDSGRQKCVLYERTSSCKDRTSLNFSTEEEAHQYKKENQQNLFTQD